MDFIDKQNIVGFKTGEHTGKITGFVEHRTGGDFKAYPKFIGNNI